MIALVIMLAAAPQPQSSPAYDPGAEAVRALALAPAPLRWSDAYWAAQRVFQSCYDRRMSRERRRGRAAQAVLDRVMNHCRAEWDGRIVAMRADIRQQRPTWSEFTLNDYLQWRYREFYNDRLLRLRYATGELHYPNIQ